MKKLLLWASLAASLIACEPKKPIDPENPTENKKYTEMNQVGNTDIYNILVFSTNDKSMWAIGISDTSKINKFLKTGIYNILWQDYNLWRIWLSQYMEPNQHQKIVWWKEISEQDLWRYFTIDWNNKINLNTYKTSEFTKDVVNYIENIYIPNKIKNKEQFVDNNYAIQLLVPRKYFGWWASGMQRNFYYTDNMGVYKTWIVAISYVWNEYFREWNAAWIANSILNYANVAWTHEMFHHFADKWAKTLNITFRDTEFYDGIWHNKQKYKYIWPAWAFSAWYSYGQFGSWSWWLDPSIFATDPEATVVTLTDNWNFNTWTFGPKVRKATELFEAEWGEDKNIYNPNGELWKTIKKDIQNFMKWQSNFTKKIPNTNGARIWANNDYNIKTELIHTDH